MAPAPPDLAKTIDDAAQPALGRAHRSIAIPNSGASYWRKLWAFAGPGYLVAVGYMDPGNWATDLAGGSGFGYSLLSVILISNILAMVLQALAARLGIATDLDLAQACRAFYPRPACIALWLLCEIAIVACDLAEVIGTAIALQLLFGIPLTLGVILTAFDTLLVLALQQFGFRKLEAFVIALLVVIAACFAIELALSQPGISQIAGGFIPTAQIVTNPVMLYIAIGIVGATVMPHNLYLHSAIVQTRRYRTSEEGKREAIRFTTIDSTIALLLAFFVNAAILILAASTFHQSGRTDVVEIQQAYQLLTPLLGATFASTLFALALLASGQNSTITATLAGQIVMQGFLNLRLRAWARRLVTRMIAIVPAVLVAYHYGASGTTKLLVFSQVVLSLQLPFAIVPLVQFTSNAKLMGVHVNPRWLKIAGYGIAVTLSGLNLTLLVRLLAL